MWRFGLLVVLAGCAPAIQSASPDSVSILYEGTVSLEDTQETAEYACGQYGKQPVLIGDLAENPNALVPDRRIATYECVTPE